MEQADALLFATESAGHYASIKESLGSVGREMLQLAAKYEKTLVLHQWISQAESITCHSPREIASAFTKSSPPSAKAGWATCGGRAIRGWGGVSRSKFSRRSSGTSVPAGPFMA